MMTITEESAKTKSEIAALLYTRRTDSFLVFASLVEKMLERYAADMAAVTTMVPAEVGFDEFWKSYDKKVARDKCIRKWAKLARADREAILGTVKKFVLAHPDPIYRPHPLTYLNQRRWEDDLSWAQLAQPTNGWRI